ncbi:hypothetical protein BLOT_014879 [Blomia tropicalis]|nr:hypothetical protein BLOT_014879 [Blomia tropicalis]
MKIHSLDEIRWLVVIEIDCKEEEDSCLDLGQMVWRVVLYWLIENRFRTQMHLTYALVRSLYIGSTSQLASHTLITT